MLYKMVKSKVNDTQRANTREVTQSLTKRNPSKKNLGSERTEYPLNSARLFLKDNLKGIKNSNSAREHNFGCNDETLANEMNEFKKKNVKEIMKNKKMFINQYKKIEEEDND